MRIAVAALLGALLTGAVFARPARADVPLAFVHSGRLLDGTDQPVDGEVDLTLRFYRKDVDAANENNLVWEHTYRAVHVSHGVYQIVVGGNEAPLKASDWTGSEPRYLGVSVGTGGEMKPRLQLAAVPWATRAQSAADADKLGGRAPDSFADRQHTHAAADVTDFAAAAVAAMGAKANDNPQNHDRYTDAEAVAAVGASAKYFTKADLDATGSGTVDFARLKNVPAYHLKGDFDASGTGTVDWSRLRNLPPGFADGTDDGNTYSAGSNGGLSLTGNAFAIAPGGVTPGMLANDAAGLGKVTGGQLGVTQDGKFGVGVASPTSRMQVSAPGAALQKETLATAMLAQNGLSNYLDTQVVDGSTTTNGWHTDTATAGAWLRVDLGSADEIVAVRVYAASPNYPGVYDIQYSDNATTWVAASAGFNPSAQGFNQRRFASVGAHRYWRLLLTNTPGGGSWLNELELYKAASGNALTVDDYGNAAVAGSLAVSGRYTGNDAQAGFLQPPTWGYSASGNTSSGWQQLWSMPLTLTHETVLSLAIDGHWMVSSSTTWCYASLTIDGVPLADKTCNNTTNSACWGASHTYLANWHPIGFTAFATVSGGTHQIGLAVLPAQGNTCSVNGARIYYAALPR